MNTPLSGSTDAYAKDGVNVSLGDQISGFAAEQCRKTWRNSSHVRVNDNSRGSFRGLRSYSYRFPWWWSLRREWRCEEVLVADGIGTKVGLIAESMNHRYAACDAIAMTCGDIVRYGGLPLIFSSVLDVSTLGSDNKSVAFRQYQQLMLGIADAAEKLGVVVTGGETAELGAFVGSENPYAATKFNMAAVVHGVSRPCWEITGKDLAAGDVVIAIREDGFRSNGFSTVRKALALKFGDEWWNNPDAKDSIAEAATPSLLVEKFLARANGWHGTRRIPVSSITHITGGGIPGKFGELLFRSGLSASLNDLYRPPEIMRKCVEWRRLDGTKFPGREVYKTFNGGQGYLVTMPRDRYRDFLQLAETLNIQAKVCGAIYAGNVPRLGILSMFDDGGVLEYRQGE